MKLKILFLTALLSLVALSAHGDGGTRVQDAVMFMINKEPGHSKKNNTQWAGEIAEAINKAARANSHDPYTLVSMAHWESRFRPDILSGKTKGPAEEIGLLQCGKQCANYCPYFMDTIEGQAMCGAIWLAKAKEACPNSLKETMTSYAAGAVCDAEKYKPKWCQDTDDPEACYKKEQRNLRAKVNRRLKLAKRLRNRFASN